MTLTESDQGGIVPSAHAPSRRRLASEVRRVHLRGYGFLALYVLILMAFWCLIGFSAAKWTGLAWAALAVAILTAGAALYAVRLGPRMILRLSGARTPNAEESARLSAPVRELARKAGIPTPSLYVIDDGSPNAFAIGFSPARASLTVTAGLLDMATADELEGVLAHEISHIIHRDTRLLLLFVAFLNLAALLTSWALRSLARSDRGSGDQSAALAGLVFVLLLAVIAYVIGPLLQLALSRARESLADLGGADLVGDARGLISSLEKLERSEQPLKVHNHSTSALYIDNPLEHHGHSFTRLFNTHPPIEERIAALQAVAGLPVTAVADHESLEEAWGQERAAAATRAKARGEPSGWKALGYVIAYVGVAVGTLVLVTLEPNWFFIAILGVFFAAIPAAFAYRVMPRSHPALRGTVSGVVLLAGLAAHAYVFSYVFGQWPATVIALVVVGPIGGWIIFSESSHAASVRNAASA